MPATAKATAVSAPIKVRVNLELDRVEWPRVRYALTHQFRLSPQAADNALKDFQKRVRQTACWCWFETSLSKLDNNIAASIADVHGGDLVTLETNKVSTFARLQIKQQLTLKPSFRSEGVGSSELETAIKLRTKTWRIQTKRNAVVLYCATALGLILTYLLAAGVMLYGAAVFLLFLADPELVLHGADGNISMYLGLFGFLTGFAALTGRAVRNLWRRLHRAH